jgi:hypothetical protein
LAFNVRIFGYRGITEVSRVLPKQFASDSVQMLCEPYEYSDVAASNGATAVAFATDTTHDKVTMLRVEVPDGSAIRYEVKPPGSTRTAGNTSPKLSGIDHFPFGAGWTFQFVDAASYL